MRLNVWAEQQLRHVDEDGSKAVRIRLVSVDSPSTWNTWEVADMTDPSAWADEAEAYLRDLAEELPPKNIQFLFLAVDASGEERSQFPRTVKGRSRVATDSVLRNEPKALAESMEAQARTMRAILESANVQIAVLTKTVSSQAEQTHSLLEFITELNTRTALEAKQSNDAMAELLAGAKEYAPAIINLIAERMLKPSGHSAAKVVAIATKEK